MAQLKGPLLKMVVDWGQVDAGLNAINGAMRGVAGKQTVAQLGPRLRQHALRDFGEKADVLSLATNGGIAHTYEWGQAGTPAGRLWYAMPTTTGTMNFAFRDSIRPVPIGGTQESDRAARSAAIDEGAERGIHIWKRKASFLEYNTSWTVEAGNPNPETLVSPGSSSPTKYLLIEQPNGEILWRRRWRNYSEYTGNFTAFFEGYWSQTAPMVVQHDLDDNFVRKVQPKIVKAIKDSARGKGRIGASTTAAMSPGSISMLVNGKPFVGAAFANRPNKAVEARIRKHMKETWKQ